MASNLPEVGKTYQFNGLTVTVVALKNRGKPRKDGLPGQVHFEAGGQPGTARMADWLKSAKA